MESQPRSAAAAGCVSEAMEQDGLDFAEMRRRRQWSLTDAWRILPYLIAVLALILAIAALAQSASRDEHDDDAHNDDEGDDDDGTPADLASVSTQYSRDQIVRSNLISRIAFGSCTSYYLTPQTVWTRGVIPIEPDAWIWAGDFVYMDNSFVNCDDHKKHPLCNCETTLLTHPPYLCSAGSLSNARQRVRMQLEEYHYQQFLQYMCPDFMDGLRLPPEGPSCPKPILGTYDDHDYGRDNANRHMEHKYEFKNLYLDAIGEPQDSIRRSSTQGIQYKYTLNADAPLDHQIDVFLLDERYERDALPCEVRRESCEETLAGNDTASYDYLWCEDFLNTGGASGRGSCCRSDDIWANGWCRDNAHSDAHLWDVACDPSSERYGSMALEIDSTTQRISRKASYDKLSDLTEVSTFCEVFGPQQRRWLRSELQDSRAALKLVVSGSVVFSNAEYVGEEGPCSGDSLECYKSAQASLIHTLDSIENGCVVVLSGDYHVSDIMAVNPGNDTKYSKYYPTAGLKRPIYEVMSSGLTRVTAAKANKIESCKEWAKDDLGLRPLGECSVVATPAFGTLDVDWQKRRVTVRHRSTRDGSVARAVNGNKQELSIDLDTCQMV